MAYSALNGRWDKFRHEIRFPRCFCHLQQIRHTSHGLPTTQTTLWPFVQLSVGSDDMSFKVVPPYHTTGCPPSKSTFRMLLEPQCTGSITFCRHPCVWRLIFWSFLTKTKQDQAPPSHVNGKIYPHSTFAMILFY